MSVEEPRVSSVEPAAGNAAPDSGQAAEIERLRARVAELETDLIELEDWANRTLGAAQERLYWLDRWHIDLNRLMTRRGASEVRMAIRLVRAAYRRVRRLNARLTRGA